jgi:hypothetical protein
MFIPGEIFVANCGWSIRIRASSTRCCCSCNAGVALPAHGQWGCKGAQLKGKALDHLGVIAGVEVASHALTSLS